MKHQRLSHKLFLVLFALFSGAVSSSAYDFEVNGICYNINSDDPNTVSVTYHYIDEIVPLSPGIQQELSSVTDDYGDGYYGNVNIPPSVTYQNKTYQVTRIGYNAFYQANVESVSIPNTVTEIERYAFAESSLKFIHVPDNVTTIDDGAFMGCYYLENVFIGKSVVELGSDVFRFSPNITSIIVDEDNPKYDSRENCKALIGTERDYLIKGCVNTVIPKSVKHIGVSAFEDVKLTSIELPESLQTIGAKAFQNCTKLTSVAIPDSVTVINLWAFSGCSALADLTLGKGVKRIGIGAFGGCKSLTGLDLPIGLECIERSAFSGCSALTLIVIPDSVTTIDQSAFGYCSGIKSVTFGKSVAEVGEDAFWSCSALARVDAASLEAWCGIQFENKWSNPLSYAHHLFFEGQELTDLVLPEGLKAVSKYAFSGCSGLTSVAIPQSVTELGDGAFQGCSGLTAVVLPDGLIRINDYLFYNCSRLASVNIPTGVTHIGKDAFCSCDLRTVVVPAAVTRIDDGAFALCPELNEVYIPDSLYSMGRNVFRNTAWLVSQPDGVVYAGNVAIEYKGAMPDNTDIVFKPTTRGVADYAFYNFKQLKSVVLSDSLLRIGHNAFYYCESMEVPEIPAKVIYLGRAAFAHCKRLTKVVCKAPVPPYLYDNCFDNHSVPLYIPMGSMALYKSTFPWYWFKNMIEVDFDYVMGDVDGDKEITISDVNCIIEVIQGTASTIPAHADVNADGEITIADVNAVIDIILQAPAQ